jgi:transcriptional regulator GlxA family with amidase domain
MQQRYCELVDRFEKIARASLGTRKRVIDLCRTAGVNQRTLSRAFRVVRGMTPYLYLRMLRLSEVKRVLSSEDGTCSASCNALWLF